MKKLKNAWVASKNSLSMKKKLMKNEKENENEAYVKLKSCGTNFDH